MTLGTADICDRALVLGPGGVLGTAWMAGLVGGLRGIGVDLGQADLTIGTSAGAIVSALLTTGQDFDRLAAPARPSGEEAPARRVDGALTASVFAVLGEPGLDPGEARRRVGRIALDNADPDAEHMLIAERGALIGADAWPQQRLLLTAVDAGTGEPAVWDRTSGIPLVRAVAASSAFPGAEPPVGFEGRWYMDGALRAGTNVDLAAGARTLVVIEPMAHLFPREQFEQEPAVVGARNVVAIGPDPDAVRALGSDLNDRAKWTQAYRAGLAQAEAAAEGLRSVWRAASAEASAERSTGI
ncbi:MULTISPECIES: patatin-like phospholipase family protein [unclassified Streptomyces]|uniref:patatin-like phospholipase family protein n=1 Tax=unclassified Streptomyces TaxID=2593676 RepID=UPI003248B7D9